MGKIIRVPADQPTIQAGINAAVNGDTVLVSPGTYKENINFNGKAITVKSQSGPGATIIDGGLKDTVVTFASSEVRSSVLSGFTVQNGVAASYYGGGVYISNSSPTIVGNVITLNSSCVAGAGIYSSGGGPLIQNNIISNNVQSCFGGLGGGGIGISGGSGIQITSNVIVGNVYSTATGGGISLSNTGSALVLSNTISNNSGGGLYIQGITAGSGIIVQNLIVGNRYGPGIYWSSPPLRVISNTVANNSAYYGVSSEIYGSTMNNQGTIENNLLVATGTWSALSCDNYDYSNPPIFSNNDVFSADGLAYGGYCPDLTGSSGNLSIDPYFLAFLSDDYHLQAGSPIIDMGLNTAPNLPGKDFDGDSRILNDTVDIGADEYSDNTALTLSSSSLRYGSEQVGSVSPPQSLTLTNQGNAKVSIRLIATGSDFVQTNTCGQSLEAGASCQIDVSFAPVGGGTRTSVLGVFTNATANPLSANLTGTGLAPAVSLSTTYLYFPNLAIGGSSTQTLTLTNTGQAPLTITGFASSNPDFVQTNDCPLAPETLAIGAFCTITVTWTPLVIGYDSGTLTITDNASPGTQTVYMNGQCFSAGVATLSTTNLTFPDTYNGTSSDPQIVTLTNTGTGPLGNINIYSYGDFPVTHDCPASLAVGASCSISVVFAPGLYVGTEYAYINVYNDGLTAPTIYATGNAVAPVPAIASLSPASAVAGSSDTSVTITGTGFVYGSQVLWNGAALYAYLNSSTQLSFTVPAANLASPGVAEVAVFSPGGKSNTLPFTIYTAVNYAAEAADYSPRVISGTNLNLGYYSSAQVISPFPIQFGGGSYANLYVGAGGTITFNGYFGNEYNDPIPTTQVPMLVAPLWSNLYPWGADTDNHEVFWQVNGTAPNRELVIEWRNVSYCCSNDPQHTVRFQVVFFEGSANILFNYGDTVFGGSYSGNDEGATATVGVQVAPGLGTQFSYNSPVIKSRTALMWYPNVPTVTLSTSTVDFGYHQIGTRSLPQKFTLTNGSRVPLQISGITIDNPDFTQINNCGTTVQPGRSCTVQVTFKPNQPTADVATLSITDDALDSPQKVTLTGIGAITPVVVFPIQLSFGGVTVGSTSTLPVTLANGSNQTMTIQQITASPSVYTQTNNCGASLGPGLSCTINVSFAPTEKGTVTGTLSMGLNGKPPATKVRMTGTGI
jgi:hypothetical protein